MQENEAMYNIRCYKTMLFRLITNFDRNRDISRENVISLHWNATIYWLF